MEIRHDYKIITAPIEWKEWTKANSVTNLRATEQSQSSQLEATTARLDNFWHHVHGRIAQHEQEENTRAQNSIAAMQQLREQQHVKEVEQRKIDNERAVARLLEQRSAAAAAADGASNEGSAFDGEDEATVSSASKVANFKLTRADELRDQEIKVASRRSKLNELREASKQIAEAAESGASGAGGNRPDETHSHEELQRIKEEAEKEAAERTAASEADERASVAQFELKRQWRMRLEEDRLRRAADRVAAEAEGKQAERDHRFRRTTEKVEAQRQLYESKQAAMAVLAEEGQRLRGIKDRKALLELKEQLLQHVADINEFCQQETGFESSNE